MRAQKGGALLIVLIFLSVMLIGAMALMGSQDMSSRLVGNSAFKQAATQYAQLGVGAGSALLKGLADKDKAATGYSPLALPVDTSGLPSVQWEGLPAMSEANGAYIVQFMVERLCTGSLPVTDTAKQCAGLIAPAAGSARVGAAAYETNDGVYFRVTVRVQGPKQSESFVQALFSA